MVSMVYIYTEQFYFGRRIKGIVKKILGRQIRGPQAVFNSLQMGLGELGEKFAVNTNNHAPIKTACVLSGVKTLQWTIDQKRNGMIQKIVAGPNIVVTPLDCGEIIADPLIDIVVVPAQYNMDWWLSLSPKLSGKIFVWPAGVEDRGVLVKPDGMCVIFYKNLDPALYKSVVEVLDQKKISHSTIRYGSFTHHQYFKILSQAKFMIYLGASESQGMALHEAWMAGVPTLVYNNRQFSYKNYSWNDLLIAAPYLTENCGMFFEGPKELDNALTQFLNNYTHFNPRAYSLEQFTNKACAKKYMAIINSL